MQLIAVGSLLLLFCACANVFPVRSFELPLKNNCTNCLSDNMQMNMREVFPRLTLIKLQIQKALNRTMDGGDKVDSTKKRPTTPLPSKPRIGTYRTNDILSFSENLGEYNGDAVLKFRIYSNMDKGVEEAVGVSLMMFVDRRRKVKKGGKGKKIFLEVSKNNPGNSSWETLTFLRTRVKKRRWKRISLPVTVAQQLLDSEDRSLDLKVKCIGCGRLVQLVLSKDTKVYKNRRMRKNTKQKKSADKRKNSTKRVKRRKHALDSRKNKSRNNSPLLIITTKYLV